ncbi:hypothetical protein Tco_1027165 [Tanacetum coccineum]
MVEPEKPLKKKDQIAIDEEVVRNLEAQLQAELEEKERLSRQKEEEDNIALIESWGNTQAMMDANFQLAQQMQTEEQEQLSIEEKLKLFVELLEKRKKHFATLRAQEKRNKPPTKAQKRNTISTYLKNMARYKHNQLKSKSYDEIQEISKRAGEELESDNSKKQRIDKHVEAKGDDDQEEAEMKKHLEIIQDNNVAIDAIPLATKPPVIVEWKIIKEGKMGYFQLIRADGSSKRYSSMIRMLQNIDREDLETLWKLVKAKHRNTRPEEAYERVLWGDLKVMFKLDVESEIWRNLQVPLVKNKENILSSYYSLYTISAAYTKVNAAGMKVTTGERLQLLEKFLLNTNVDTTPRYKNDNQTRQVGNQRTVTVDEAKETIGSQECRKPKRVKDYMYHKEKMLLYKQAAKGVPLQAEQADWLEDTDKEIDEQELEACYSFMAKIQEVLLLELNSTAEPLEQVDSNVIPDSPDMYDNDIQTD